MTDFADIFDNPPIVRSTVQELGALSSGSARTGQLALVRRSWSMWQCRSVDGSGSQWQSMRGGYDVRDFSASLTDDVIQATIDACEAAGGGDVLVPPGLWVCSNTVSVPDSVNVIGSGRGATVLKGIGTSFSGSAVVLLTGRSGLYNLDVVSPDKVNGDGSIIAAVRVDDGDGAIVSNVRATDARHACIYVVRGEDVHIDHCYASSDVDNASTLGYGIMLAGCAYSTVSNTRAHGRRHGVTVGYIGGDPPAASNRVYACRISGDTQAGANVHADCTDNVFESCKIANGANIGGIRSVVRDCEIEASVIGPCVLLQNLGTLDVTIDGNTLTGDVSAGLDTDAGAIDWDRPADPAPTGGTMRITNNAIRVTGRAAFLRNRWDVDLNLIVQGNEIDATDDFYIRSIDVPSRWPRVFLKNNHMLGVGALNYGANVDTAYDAGNDGTA